MNATRSSLMAAPFGSSRDCTQHLHQCFDCRKPATIWLVSSTETGFFVAIQYNCNEIAIRKSRFWHKGPARHQPCHPVDHPARRGTVQNAGSQILRPDLRRQRPSDGAFARCRRPVAGSTKPHDRSIAAACPPSGAKVRVLPPIKRVILAVFPFDGHLRTDFKGGADGKRITPGTMGTLDGRDDGGGFRPRSGLLDRADGFCRGV